MINTEEILEEKKKQELTLESVLKKITEYDIYAKYLGDFKIGKLINSPFRKDNNPSFCLYVSKTGSIRFKDFGTTEPSGNIIDFIKKYYNISDYKDALLKITEDLKIKDIELKHRNYSIKPKNTKISIKRKPFSKIDLNYWNSFGISEKTLEIFKVSAISYCLTNGIVSKRYSEKEPLYAYKVFDKFKIYNPLGKKIEKWKSNLSSLDIQGFEQLPENGNLLFITKSLKDVMSLYELGFNAVAPPSESSDIPEIVINNLKKRFKKIILFYDRDKTGLNRVRKLKNKYNLDFIFINKIYNEKDISDFIKTYGKEKALLLINNKLNG